MVVTDNTRLEMMEADIKKLYQLLEDNAGENRAEIARLMEANLSTLDTIHQALNQRGTVVAYYAEFIALANRTHVELPEALRDYFISGLRMEIKRKVKAQCPPSLMRVLSLARLYEDKFSSSFKATSRPNTSRPPTYPTYTNPQPKPSLPPLLPTPTQKPLHTPNCTHTKRLTTTEQQLRREKGLCYWCDDKFTPIHKCPNRNFMLYQMEEKFHVVSDGR
ncbi:hypothetical protein SESBI_41751 [Sesbania bispinosa]|nr:hypothetical protein SESBI_41751 [Sesbania bispinosa]